MGVIYSWRLSSFDTVRPRIWPRRGLAANAFFERSFHQSIPLLASNDILISVNCTVGLNPDRLYTIIDENLQNYTVSFYNTEKNGRFSSAVGIQKLKPNQIKILSSTQQIPLSRNSSITINKGFSLALSRVMTRLQ